MVFSFLKPKAKYERDHEKEYLVKAAMLIKFHKLTTWPQSVKLGNKKAVNICVTGENPFSPKTQNLFSLGSNTEVQYKFLKGDAYKRKFCHIVYVGKCDKEKIEDVLDAVKSVPTLTVSDIPGFSNMGGNIELTIISKSDKDQKIKLIINEQSALEKGLTFAPEMKAQGVSKLIRKSN